MGQDEAPVLSHQLAFEAFGVRVSLGTNDEQILARLQDFLPPGASACDPSTAQQRFGLTSRNGSGFQLQLNDEWTIDYRDVELALGLLDTHMCGYIAVNASERIFVHAGAVSYDGRLIVIPGGSFSGKSSLVAALVRAGASYYSDDYAVLDAAGRVHPYPKPLSLRGKNLLQTTHTAESLGGTTGVEPQPPSLIVLANYRKGAEWRPRRLSGAAGVLAVLTNTLPARERPEESMQAVTSAVSGARVLQGERGEAEEVVPLLLAELERPAPEHE